MTNPACIPCGGTGTKVIDTSHLGDCNDWNPGSARVRCDCNPMTEAVRAAFVDTMKELDPETDWEAVADDPQCECAGCQSSLLDSSR